MHHCAATLSSQNDSVFVAQLTQDLECFSSAILAELGLVLSLLLFKGGITLCQAVYAEE